MQKNIYIPIDTTINKLVECEKLVKRGDTLTLTIKIFTNGELADLTDQSIDLILRKADNTLIESTITNVTGGVITATLTEQATLAEGLVSGEIQIYNLVSHIATNTFIFAVSSSIADDVLKASENEIETLIDLKNVIDSNNAIINEYVNNVTAIAGTVESVEALANITSYIDTNLADLERENAEAVVNVATEATKNTEATNNIANLTPLIASGNTLKAGLEADIITGNTLNTSLGSKISIGSILKTGLESDITSGNTLKNNLESDITAGNTLKTQIDAESVRAEANIVAMQGFGDATALTQNVTNLKSEVETARNGEVSLDVRMDKNDVLVAGHTASLSELANQNLLINGDFQVWQRGTSFTDTYQKYTADRWYCLSSNNQIKVEKVANGMKLTGLADNSTFFLFQKFEDDLKNKNNGKPVTLSKSIDGVISKETFNFGEKSTLYQITLNTNESKIVNWIKLELGSNATPFVPRPIGEELALCQRYYEKSYDSSISSGGAIFSIATSISVLQGFQFKVTKRAIPTAIILSPSGTISRVWSPSDVDVTVAIGANNVGINGVRYIGGVGAFTIGTGCSYHYTADAEIY